MSLLKDLSIEERGQDMVEYGLVIALVVIVGATAYATFGTQISTAISNVGSSIVAVF